MKINIGKVLSKAIGITKGKPITVAPSIVTHQAAVLARQILLTASGGLVANGTLSGDQQQQIVGGLVALGTVVVGQLKARKNKAEAIVLANAAPDRVGTIKGQD